MNGASLLLFLLTACQPEKPPHDSTEPTDTGRPRVDEDGDGATIEADCDDQDASVYPDAPEVCDEIDNDCDGLRDEADEDLDATTMVTTYADEDGDGYGDPDAPQVGCAGSATGVTDDTDCDDSDAAICPGAEDDPLDGLDTDCDGNLERDEDGDTSVSDEDGGPDCDDADDTVNPEADEVWDGTDDDCDGAVDDLDLGALVYDLGLYCGYHDGSGGGSRQPFAFAGDVDGDGLGDLVTGGTGCDLSSSDLAPAVRVFTGPIEGRESVTTAAAMTFVADAEGLTVTGLGDVDGDGRADLGVGGWDTDTVYVLLDPPLGESALSDADAIWSGVVESGYTGWSLAPLPAWDDEGAAALAIGATLADAIYVIDPTETGSVSLDSALASVEGDGYGLGYSVACAGDIDGDGLSDLIAGATTSWTGGTDYGDVHVWLGPIEGALAASDADGTLEGRDVLYNLGMSVAGVGDTDGDGLDDYAVGAPGWGTSYDPEGAVYLFLGPTASGMHTGASAARLDGTEGSEHAGSYVIGAGDVDADGFTELVVIGPGEGHAYIINGPLSGAMALTEASAVATDSSSSSGAVWTLAGGGDATGDGAPDLLIGDDWMDGEAILVPSGF